jgi:predicted outer membrane protein
MTPSHVARNLALALLIPGAACFRLHHPATTTGKANGNLAKPAPTATTATAPTSAPAAATAPTPAPAAPAKTVAAAPAPAKNTRPAKAPKAPKAVKSNIMLPTEANVGAMLLAAGNSDMSYAQIASARAQSQPVKDYVARMMRDGATVNQLVYDVMNKMQLDPVENAASLEYRDESAMNRDMLRDMQGRAFDSTYMANEVAHHEHVLATIDKLMIPAAKRPELKQLLTNLRPVVVAQRDHAEQVRQTLDVTK